MQTLSNSIDPTKKEKESDFVARWLALRNGGQKVMDLNPIKVK